MSAITPTTAMIPVHIPASKIPSIAEQLLSANMITHKMPITFADKCFEFIFKFYCLLMRINYPDYNITPA